ncbi:MAG: hypothetical protein RJA22_2319 [Verrucomicrobiota bacterium]
MGCSLPVRGADAVIRALDVTIPRGETNRVLVVLEAQGNENAIAFSLCFDTNMVSFVRAVRGVDAAAASATLVVGTSQATRGRVGMLLGLDVASGQVFSAGNHQIVELYLRGAPGAGTVTTPISFCDLPTTREVSDVEAGALPASYVDATITVAGSCTYSLGSSLASFPAAGGSNTVAVTAGTGCAWGVSNAPAWLSVLSGTPGVGNGQVVLAAQANPGPGPRGGSLLIAGVPFAVTQEVASCVYTLSPTNRSHGAGAATNSVSLLAAAACPWTASSTQPWLILLSPASGSGPASLEYSVSANPGLEERVATLQVADQQVTIRQAGLACTYSLSPTNRNHGFGAATNSVAVSTDPVCAWTASTTNAWLTLLAPSSGTGSGSLQYWVAANPDTTERVGHIQVGGEVVTLRQAGRPCVYTLSPTNRNHGTSAATNSFSINADAGCAWAATTTNAWISLATPVAGTGPGAVTYQIAANPDAQERIGHIEVAGQILTLRQAGLACAYLLSPTNRTHGAGAASNSVSVTTEGTCLWTATTSNAWITLLLPAAGAGSGSVSYQVAPNPDPVERVGYIQVGDQTVTLRQSALNCAYAISPTNRNHGAGAATNSVAIDAQEGCDWVATTTNSWVTLVAPAAGAGPGTLVYQLLANPGSEERLAYIQVGGQWLTLRQAGLLCTYALSPTNRNHGSGAATNSVAVSADAGCAWAANTTNGWITLLSPASGTGSGSVQYQIPANPDVVERVGHIQVAGQVMVVRQAGLVCSYSLSPTNRNHGFGSASNSFTVSTGSNCPWTAATTNSWITISSAASGVGPATVSYAVAPNPNPAERLGAIQVGDKVLTLRQAGITCTYAISPTTRAHGTGAATNTFTVTAGATCPWTVTNTNAWVILLAGATGTGTGMVTYAVLENTGPLERTGVVQVAGQSLVLRQAGATCSFTLSPTNRSHGYAAATNSFSVAAGTACEWTPTTTNGWISLGSAGPLLGNGVVTYTVAANPGALSRTGHVQVADRVFALVQDGQPCSLTVSPASRIHGFSAASNTLSITAPPGCAWSIVHTSAWVTLDSPASGSGDASIPYAVAPNPSSLDRVTVILVGSETVTLTQRGAPCLYELSPTNAVSDSGAVTGVVSVTTATNCMWVATTTNAWISLPGNPGGSGSGTLTYVLAPNTSTEPRVGQILVGSEPFVITQAGAACAYRLSPALRTHGYAATSNGFSVVAGAACSWTALSSQPWITLVSGQSGAGDGAVGYQVAANPLPTERTGTVTVADQVFTLVQLGAPCTFALSPSARTHGAGAASNAVTLTTLSGCSWEVLNTNSWVTFVPPVNGTNSALLPYLVAENPDAVERVARIYIGGELLTITQRAASCSFTLSTESRTHGFAAATNSVTLTTLGSCGWTASSTNAWVQLVPPLSGTGSVTLQYSVEANPLTFWRTGHIVVAGQVLTLAQRPAPCTVTLATASLLSPAAGLTGEVGVVSASDCPWMASTTNDWIQLVSGASGTGNGLVQFTVAANPDPVQRVGSLAVGDASLVITQAPASCTVTLSSATQSFNATAATGSVSVVAAPLCPWSVVNTNTWLRALEGSGSGPAVVTYVLDSNESPTPRSGFLVIGGQPLAITQAGAACTYRLSPTNRTHGYGATTGSVSVVAAEGCSWQPESNVPWITLQAGFSGSGGGAVSYVLSPNESLVARTGTVTVADQTLVVVQQAITCAYSLSPSSRTHGNGTVTNAFFVNTASACPWTVLNTNAWINLLSSPSGQGSGIVQYWVVTNEATVERVGALQVGGQSLIITQRAAPCVFTLSSTNTGLDYTAQTGQVTVTTGPNCAWTAENTNSWITLLGATNGTGTAVLRYAVSVNMGGQERSGRLRLAGQDYQVTQAASPCLYGITPAGQAHPAAGGTGTVSVSAAPGCEWVAASEAAWVTLVDGLAGAGPGEVRYVVQANASTAGRTGLVMVAGQYFTVTQEAAPCAFALNPTQRAFTHLAGSATVSISAPAGCAWTAVSTNSWISLTTAPGATGNGSVSYAVAANPTAIARTGYVMVEGQVLVISQAGIPCAYAIVPTGRSHGYAAETGSVALTTEIGCPWTATSTNDWITLVSGGSGSSNGTVTYVLGANPTALVRSGHINVAGSSFAIQQAAAPCSYALSTNLLLLGYQPGTGTVEVQTPLGCPWSITSTNPWITVSGAASGTNSRPIEFLLATNAVTVARTGMVTVAGLPLTIVQAAAPCSFTLTPATAMAGSGAVTGLISVVTSSNCSWTATSSNAWITVTAGASRTGNGTVGYSVAANPAGLARTGLLRIGDQSFVVSQAAAPCVYGLAAPGATHPAGASSGSLTVTTLVGCAWTALTTNAWITVNAGAAGTNTGTAGYAVAANPDGIARTGSIQVGGLSFTVTQAAAPCTYSLSVASQSHESTGATGSVQVTTLLGCPWVISNPVPWISVVGPVSRTNSSQVLYTVAPNPTGLTRTGSVYLAGQPLLVTQAAAPCTYTLTPSTRTVNHLVETGIISVATLVGCPWTATSSAGWLSLVGTSTGTNSGTVGYRAASNDTALARTGLVTVAGQTFALIQSGAPCSFTLGSTSRSHGSARDTGTVSVATLTGCSWSAVSTNAWITIAGAATSTNSGSASYVVEANPTALSRTGLVTVAGQSFTVIQAGAACSFSLSSATGTHGPAVETNTIQVTTLVGCSWTVANTNGWIQIAGTPSRTNSGGVTYTVQANPTALARTGVVTLAGQSLVITQTGAPCTFSLSPSSRSHGAAAETGSVSVVTLVGCAWESATATPWITLLGTNSGSGPATVSYRVEPNPTAIPRSGSLTIAGQTLAVTQAGAACNYEFLPASWVHRSGSETGVVTVTSLVGCNWTVQNTNAWITLIEGGSGSGSGSLAYVVSPNAGTATRAGNLVIEGRSYPVSQLGSSCGYRLSPTNRYHGFGAATNTISVTATSGCPWSVVNTNPWLTILSGASGTGNGTVSYAVTANRATEPRTGLLNIGGEFVTFTQWGTNCAFALQPASRSHGHGADTGQVQVAASSSTCAWVVENTNQWLTVLGSGSGTGGATLTYTLAANPGTQPRTALFRVQGESFTVVQAGMPCAWTLTPTERNHGHAGQTNSVTVSTMPDCNWSVLNTNSWITTLATGGVGSGTVGYVVASNTSARVRSGTLVIGGQVFQVSQDPTPCHLLIEPSSRSHSSGSDAGLISVATVDGCPWSVVNTNSWITLSSGAGGSASGTVLYTVDANPSSLPRSGNLVVGGVVFAVSQAGAACTTTLSPATRSHGAGAETGTVSVVTAAGCNWTVLNPHPWIFLLSAASGTGPGSLTYSVAPNDSTTARTGVVSIAGQSLTIQQGGAPCAYSVAPQDQSQSRLAGTGSFQVTAGAGCTWTATTTNPWIQITAGASGSGSGTVAYSVAANPGASRVGWISVGGQQHGVSQQGSLRVVRVSDASVARGQTNRLLVVLESQGDENALGFSLCFDTNALTFVRAVRGVDATNAAATFNTNLLSSARGQIGFAFGLDIGSGQTFAAGSNVLAEVFFRAAASGGPGVTTVTLCDTPVAREVSDVLAEVLPASYGNGSVALVSACSYTLGASSVDFGAAGGTATVAVQAGPGCAWTVQNAPAWVQVTSGASGTGSASVALAVQANPSSLSRTGILSVAGQPLSVTQAGAACAFVLSPSSATAGFASGSGSVEVTAPAGCAWTVINTNGWITFEPQATNGSGPAILAYSLAANASQVPRSGVVVIGGQPFTVQQAAAPCVHVLSPAVRSVASTGGTGGVTVATTEGCSWAAVTTNAWITVTPGASGTGNGSFGYEVAFNYSAQARTGAIAVAAQVFVITQAGSTCGYAISPSSRSHAYQGATNTITVSAAAGCTWDVINTSSWVTVTTPLSNTGGGTVTYVVVANPGGNPRSAVLWIAGSPFTVAQDASPCAFAIAPTTVTVPAAGATSGVSVATFAGCTWFSSTTNAWITLRAPTNGVGVGSFGYVVAANPFGSMRTGYVMLADQWLTIAQSGAPCSYNVTPLSPAVGHAASTNTLSVTSLTGCPWSVSNGVPWITVLSGTNGTGSGSVSYAVAANPTGLPRSATLLVGGLAVAVTQSAAPCTYSLSQAAQAWSAGASTGSVTLTTLPGCSWTVQVAVPWVELRSPAAGTGPAVVSYAVGANPTAYARTGVVTVAGLSYVVTQAGAPCTYELTPAEALWGSGTATAAVAVTAVTGCSWAATTTNDWVVLLSGTNGTGGGIVDYALLANPGAAARTGLVEVAGQFLRLVQEGAPCVAVLSPTNQVMDAAGGVGSFEVALPDGCPWTVTSTNNWIALTTGTSGSGRTVVGYTIQANPSPSPRSGCIMVAGTPFPVEQSGVACTYAITPPAQVLTSGNVTGLISVATSSGCSWVTVNTNPWIAIKSGESGTGPGLVRYTAAANPNPSTRTGYLVVGGQPHSVTQLGSPCTYTLSPTNRLHGSGSETGLVSVFTVNECAWTVVTSNSWITPTLTNAAGNLAFGYQIAPNPTANDRVGYIQVANQSFAITQLGSPCTVTLGATNASHGPGAETNSLAVSTLPGCTWTVTKTNTWITILTPATGVGTGMVTYALAANTNLAVRSAVIRIGTQPFTVTQDGMYCTWTLGITNAVHGSGAETGLFSVTTSNLCPWTLSTTNAWITFPGGTSFVGSGQASYALSANPSPAPRYGTIVVAGQVITVGQAGINCTYSIFPPARTHGYLSETSIVAVATSNLCQWGIQNTNPWITVLGPTNHSSSINLIYIVGINPTTNARTGNLLIAGQVFPVTQAGLFFTCPTNRTVECGSPWMFDEPTPNGGCTNPGTTITIVSTTTNLAGQCGATYSASRVWRAVDACGGTLLCTQVVRVVDTTAPVLTCAPGKVADCLLPWSFDEPTVLDTCSGAAVAVSVQSTTTNRAGACGGAYLATRVWEAVDACGNRSTCVQTVEVRDLAPPVLTCLPNRVVNCGEAWDFDSPSAVDGCGGAVTLRVVDTVTNASCGLTYSATRTWEAVDGCTNRATCSQTVQVVDAVPPVFTCPPTKVVECGQAWSFDSPVATDSCGAVTLSVVSTVTNSAGFCGSTRTISRTWKATDACGNSNLCTQLVRIVDLSAPVMVCLPARTVEWGAAWNFDRPTVYDSCSGTNVTLLVLSTVTNTAGFCGAGYSVTRTWQAVDGCTNQSATCSQTIRVVDTTAPVLVCAPSKTVNCTQPWDFDPPTATDLASGTNVTVVVAGTVTNGVCGGAFSVTRTWRATDGCTNSATCSQTVTGIATVTVAGTIVYPASYPAGGPSDQPVAGVAVAVSGPTNVTAVSSAAGAFSVTLSGAGSYTVTPSGGPTNAPSAGVSTLDISLIRRHVLSITNLDSPYKILAADVNGSSSVSTLDISFIRRLILAATNSLPQGLWRYVPADHVFANPSSPWSAPASRTVSVSGADAPGQNFIALKLGDVNASWVAPILPAGAFRPAEAGPAPLQGPGPEVAISLSRHTALPGQSVTVQVTAAGVRRVTSLQGTLAWDPAVLRFESAAPGVLAGFDASCLATQALGQGLLPFSWDDPGATGVSAPDGSVAFTVTFTVVGRAGTMSPLSLGDLLTPCEVGLEFAPGKLTAMSGQVLVMDGSEPQLAQPELAGGAFQLPLPTVAGRRYILEYTDTLPATNWTPLPAVDGDGTRRILIDPSPNALRRFYRVRIE